LPALATALACLTLPETMGKPLPETNADMLR
jgi:hypothetical protein